MDAADPAADLALVQAIRAGLAEVADPTKATGMTAYMKSAMPYLGVPAPGQDRFFRRVFGQHVLDGEESWRDTVLTLWRQAAYREERYAAIALTGHRHYRQYQRPAALPVYEQMVVDGAWWDYVDAVAVHRVGPLLSAYPGALGPVMRRWSTNPDRWRRRASIICQIGAKGAADLNLLYACVEPNLGDQDFFIRKAIGWAPRQYAWADPDEVERYVREQRDRLSPLSRREALKNKAKIRQRAAAADDGKWVPHRGLVPSGPCRSTSRRSAVASPPSTPSPGTAGCTPTDRPAA